MRFQLPAFVRRNVKSKKNTSRRRHLSRRLQLETLEDRTLFSLSPWNVQPNTVIGKIQENPAVAMDEVGRQVVAWEHVHSSTDRDIRAQIYDQYNKPVGSEIFVSSRNSNEHDVAVAIDQSSGQFLVTWTEDIGQDQNIRAARYSINGTRLSEFLVANSTRREYEPSVAAMMNGAFFVSYTYGQTSTNGDIKLALFDRNDRKAFETTVSNHGNNEGHSSIASENWHTVVAYQREYSGSDVDVRVASYTGYTFQWDKYADYSSRRDTLPSVDLTADGLQGVVAYESQGGFGTEIHARTFDSTGFTRSEILVEDQYDQQWSPWFGNMTVPSQASRPVVGTDDLADGFVVAYQTNGKRVQVREVSSLGAVGNVQYVGHQAIALATPALAVGNHGHYFVAASNRSTGEIFGQRGFINQATNARRVLYLNFDGQRISRADLEGWNADWALPLSNIDVEQDGIVIERYLAGDAARQQVIARTLALVRADLTPFGVEVRLHDGSAVIDQEATTIFVGRNNITADGVTGSHIAGDVDFGNDNRTDIAFVNEERWYRTPNGQFAANGGTNSVGLPPGITAATNNIPANSTFNVEASALALADVIIHEGGHTFGLYHVASGAAAETMGLRYNATGSWTTEGTERFWELSSWIVDTRFMDQQFNEFVDASGVPHGDGAGPQNSFRTMRAAFGWTDAPRDVWIWNGGPLGSLSPSVSQAELARNLAEPELARNAVDLVFDRVGAGLWEPVSRFEVPRAEVALPVRQVARSFAHIVERNELADRFFNRTGAREHPRLSTSLDSADLDTFWTDLGLT